MSFGITPANFNPAVDAGFPKFLQFQQDGANVGDTLVQTVNFTGGPALSLSSDGGTVTIDMDGSFAWGEAEGDYELTADDIGNGVATTGTSGAQVITIPADADVPALPGDTILVYQEGEAQAQIVGAPGVMLRYRSFAFNPNVAGQDGILSIINRAPDVWILCGDLEQVAP
jgi:hypothetical protein